MFFVITVFMPVFFLLLFVGVLGGSLSKSLGVGATAVPYIVYVTPGILAMAVGSSVSGTAIGITTDKAEGIMARFRTMAIAPTSVLTGAVVISVIRTLLGIVLLVGVALLFGFRTSVGFSRGPQPPASSRCS